MAPPVHDAAVVGGGLGGLVAASHLAAAGKSVRVYEAAGEVGGRTRTRIIEGQSIDLGGELVSASYRRVPALVRALGLHLERTALERARVRWPAELRPELSPAALTSLARALRELQRLTRALPPAAPWEARQALDLDAISFGHWLREQEVTGGSYRLVAALAETFTTTPVQQLSLLHGLWWLRADGGLVAALTRAGRPRVLEGAQVISRRLADRLDRRVQLDAHVVAIEQADSAVQLRLGDGRTDEARQAIVCVPIAVTNQINFEPALPALQHAAGDELNITRATKVAAVVGREARPAHHRLALGTGRLAMTWRHDRRLEGFAIADHADNAGASLIAELARAFDLATDDLAWATTVAWHHEPHIGGAYIGALPGQLTAHGPQLRLRHRRVHFAGGDRSSRPGSMEGAIESGERAGRALLRLPR